MNFYIEDLDFGSQLALFYKICFINQLSIYLKLTLKLENQRNMILR
jgi:hypothetical protein